MKIAPLRCKSKPEKWLEFSKYPYRLITMTHIKTLFVAVLLSSAAALSFAKAPVASKKGHATAVTASTGHKVATKANRHKSTRSAKNSNKVQHTTKKMKKAQGNSQSNSKGPGLEAY